MSLTTPQQQKEAAEAARKDGEKKDEAPKPGAPVPQPTAGSKQTLQTPTSATPKSPNTA